MGAGINSTSSIAIVATHFKDEREKAALHIQLKRRTLNSINEEISYTIIASSTVLLLEVLSLVIEGVKHSVEVLDHFQRMLKHCYALSSLENDEAIAALIQGT